MGAALVVDFWALSRRGNSNSLGAGADSLVTVLPTV